MSAFTKRWKGCVGVTLALATTFSTLPVASAAEQPLTVDGKTSETAAASCFEIKQNNPSAPSGSYWLYTPDMDAPGQFYCDQETDGGGWVMIGRGREGWTENDNGVGDPAEIATNPDGTDAFKPVQLPSATVDALNYNQPPKDQYQGTRIRRALDNAGTEWQEFRATRDQVENWSWGLSAYANWSDIKFDNPRLYYGFDRTWGTSKDRIIGLNLNYNAMYFVPRNEQNRQLGFGYGPFIRGEDNDTSYVYSYQRNGYALPFTQIYQRPKVTQADLKWPEAIGDQGTARKARVQLPNSYTEPMKWRTSEQTGTGSKGEMNSYGQAFGEVNGTVFVGGDYKFVQSAAGEQVQQPFLTGYDVNTGELVRTFTPRLNGQVKSLVGLPNGKLAVGGEFTQVNGEPNNGFVVLDPVTGEIDRTFNWKVENRGSSGTSYVKDMQVSNGYLYLAGRFTHVTGHTSDVAAFARNAARIKLSNGGVDWQWRPNFNGTVNGLNASDDGQNVFAAGYFSTLGGETAYKLATINPVDGSRLREWTWKLSFNLIGDQTGFQFDVQDSGDTVFTGGSEHIIAQYSKADYSRLSSAITKSGGDFQDLSRSPQKDVIYGACHCGDWIYEGSDMWQDPWPNYTNVYQIKLIAAFDAVTGRVLGEFSPQISGASGYGIWDSFTDSKGVLWVGGDINTSMGARGPQRTVGFARFAPRDAQPPVAPSALRVVTDGTTDQMDWAPVAEAGVKYQVLRNNKVIATVDEPSYSVAHQDGARYFVRAVDAAGNLSASTPVAVASQGQLTDREEASGEVLAYGSTWDYKLGTEAFGEDWNAVRTLVTGWSSGKAALGWGSAPLATTLEKATATSFIARHDLELFGIKGRDLKLTTYADDGLVIYVNGREVKRSNMPEGTVTHTTYATAAPSTATAQSKPVEVTVPAEYLREGKNVIAVSVHSNYRSTPSVSFDLKAEMGQ
ncbi:fibrinogen-like YCDxxxxGGGW domain-containing protein [Rothia sp. LK2588]|uniref:fibrinogen-like YCDxxxxGGGW domain-containing protein n=1 Tax=Rothia sp. LK2588 TaxID=3114369 RepID=UPI0034CE14E1